MSTIIKHKISSVLLAVLVVILSYPSFATAANKSQRVHEICECIFPAEIGAYQYLKAIKARYTTLKYSRFGSVMVREIFAERKGSQFRIISLVGSTETSSVGKEGQIIEVAKWNGQYWPPEVLYQLTSDQIHLVRMKLNEN